MLPYNKKIVGTLGVVVLLLGTIACEKSDVALPVEVLNAVMPALPPGQSTGVVYLTLRNNTDNTLVANYLYSDITDHIEVHRNYYENGMMKMRAVRHLTLDPKTKMQFEPGGYHLMLFDIVDTPSLGSQFDLTLEFEGGRSVTTSVTVKDR